MNMGVYYNQQGNPKLQALSEALSSPFASSWRTFRARGGRWLANQAGQGAALFSRRSLMKAPLSGCPDRDEPDSWDCISNNIGAQTITNIMIPYSLYNHGLW